MNTQIQGEIPRQKLSEKQEEIFLKSFLEAIAAFWTEKKVEAAKERTKAASAIPKREKKG